MMNREDGYVMIPALLVLTLVLILISSSADAYITEKRFSKEASSKLMLDHLLLLAKEDYLDYVNRHSTVGENGILYYENGDVFYRIESKTNEDIKVLLYASSRAGGKAEVAYMYSISKNIITKWIE